MAFVPGHQCQPSAFMPVAALRPMAPIGSGGWATLHAGGELRLGTRTLPAGIWYLALHRDAKANWSLAVLDPTKINVGVTVFVSIKTDQHSLEWLERFHAAVRDLPEVVEFYRMSGEVDYMMRVVVPSIAAYDAFYKKLIARIDISKVSSAFAMEQIKSTTELPLSYALRKQD